MSIKKTLQELTIKDNFMFGAVMSDENNCHRLLELILGFPIAKVEVSREKSMIYHPEYKGVRLDVYAEDVSRTHYNVEMQAFREPFPGKRARYYHSHIDMESLRRGAEYMELSGSYVIFICDFDPFGEEKYCYTFERRCLESEGLSLQDESKSIFLSTRGKNKDEVSAELVRFLEFVKADLQESRADFQDDFVKSLQASVQRIKASRDMEERFMLLELMINKERKEGRAEGKAEVLIELLEELGTVPEDLRAMILQETNLEVLSSWVKKAARAESVEQFREQM